MWIDFEPTLHKQLHDVPTLLKENGMNKYTIEK